jgi:hypothetical protein
VREVDMEALDDLLGHPKAIDKFNKSQLLELELRAIEFWDSHYYADHPNCDNYEVCAFQARQARKAEIFQELGWKKQTPKFRQR